MELSGLKFDISIGIILGIEPRPHGRSLQARSRTGRAQGSLGRLPACARTRFARHAIRAQRHADRAHRRTEPTDRAREYGSRAVQPRGLSRVARCTQGQVHGEDQSAGGTN